MSKRSGLLIFQTFPQFSTKPVDNFVGNPLKNWTNPVKSRVNLKWANFTQWWKSFKFNDLHHYICTPKALPCSAACFSLLLKNVGKSSGFKKNLHKKHQKKPIYFFATQTIFLWQSVTHLAVAVMLKFKLLR